MPPTNANDPLRTTDHIPDLDATGDHVPGLASTVDSHPAATLGADAPASWAADLPAVPGYRVLREIARGGMGRVLAAYDHSLDRDVALKVLLPGANADRFVRESKITARLPHPGIPPVHALGTLADGSPFLAMKLIAGQTLAVEMKSADRPRLLQAFTQVCQAVGFAHSRGIIHRDLKPANVMVGAFGEVQVMDWGPAKDLTFRDVPAEPRASQVSTVPVDGVDPHQTIDHRWPGESTDDQTKAGQVMGTPAYMAPEQARGEAGDARADVFALGGLLCAILTGQPPFTGKSTLEVIQRARAADLAEATARFDGCGADAELVALCRRCLSASPADRPADGQAVADGLTAYLDGVQERLQTAQRERAVALAREAEQRKRRKVQLALAATLVLAVLGGTAGAGIYVMKAEKERRDAAVRDATEQGRLERNSDAVGGLLDQAEDALRAGSSARATELLDAAARRADEGGADNSLARLARLRADLAVLIDLDKVDQFGWITFSDRAAVAVRVRDALVRFGLQPESVSAQEAAERVSGSAVRDRLLVALDEWMSLEKLPWVRAMLQGADPHPYRDAVRDAFLAQDGEAQGKLAGQRQAAEQPPGFVAFYCLRGAMTFERRRELLVAAVRRQPDDLGVLMALGLTSPANGKDGAGERLLWFQAAVGAAPRNGAVHCCLGLALYDAGRKDDALASLEQATRFAPDYAGTHSNLGNVLAEKGRFDEAIASFRKAIDLEPKNAYTRMNLGNALVAKGDVDAAIASIEKAIELEPNLPFARQGLAILYYNNGNGYGGSGKVDQAIASYKKAIELNPQFAEAHIGLGRGLRSLGRFAEALDALRRGHELGTKKPGWRSPSAEWVREAERMVALDGKLPEFLKGEFKPKDTTERLGLAGVCQARKLHHAATRLYTDAFAAESGLADNPQAGHRYNAACSAAQAAGGQGEDAAKLDDKERDRLRKQAIDWLGADLTIFTKLTESGPANARSFVQQTLKHWQQDSDLAGIRDADALAKLPAEERVACEKLWADVAALLKKAETPAPKKDQP